MEAANKVGPGGGGPQSKHLGMHLIDKNIPKGTVFYKHIITVSVLSIFT